MVDNVLEHPNAAGTTFLREMEWPRASAFCQFRRPLSRREWESVPEHILDDVRTCYLHRACRREHDFEWASTIELEVQRVAYPLFLD